MFFLILLLLVEISATTGMHIYIVRYNTLEYSSPNAVVAETGGERGPVTACGVSDRACQSVQPCLIVLAMSCVAAKSSRTCWRRSAHTSSYCIIMSLSIFNIRK